MFNNSRVLVTGGAGFIGTSLIARLLNENCHIRATVHQTQPRIHDSRIEYVSADLTQKEDCIRVTQGMDYVFMCAAVTSGALAINATPLIHVTPNVVMNAYMLEASYNQKVKKFLFISSSAAYPPTGNRPVREEEMFGEDPYPVYYFSGWMKRYSEILCKTYAEKINPPMSVVVIRPSNAYGPYDKFDFRTSHVTAALIRKVIERQNPLVVWGTGNDVRDLIYIDDLVGGMLLAFRTSEKYLTVNIASGLVISVKELVNEILALDNYFDADIEYDSSKPSTIPQRQIDTSYAKKILGFQAKTPLTQGLRKTIDWYRNEFSVIQTKP
ncbi:MAG: NAD-dependent epimerase/dehydratase family protein [Candidatus Omnitrophica bacterium]|nr:NAD-dependent epimerase/dehydratase family protein [Candidatus Omnitrophota bacterium]